MESEALTALYQIARLGARPITEYGCKTRKDFMLHVDKMWQIALAVIEESEKYDHLTDEQKRAIGDVAKESVLNDADRSFGYLIGIIRQWIDGMSIEDQLSVISSDEETYRPILGFDPETGKEWDENED